MFCVYAILSERTGRIYVGQSADVEARVRSHNRGRVGSTAADTPWILIKQQSFSTRNEARWFEFSLKRSRGHRLRWLAKGP
ncbi:MAG: GIY-YIG nuclease family protein [Pyrinomonadaceae bacterium]|nr:GIY-YIG nuclease family protein [Pyrinomonadaceae bacterium]